MYHFIYTYVDPVPISFQSRIASFITLSLILITTLTLNLTLTLKLTLNPLCGSTIDNWKCQIIYAKYGKWSKTHPLCKVDRSLSAFTVNGDIDVEVYPGKAVIFVASRH